MPKGNIKKWNKLPKMAIPNDKESWIGKPNSNNSRYYYKFVYDTEKIKYIATNENPNYKLERICIIKEKQEKE